MSKWEGDPGYAGGWCIHYRYNRGIAAGSFEDTCEAGVNFADWKDIPHARRPCFLDKQGNSKKDAATCTLLRRPTKEEIKLHNEWIEGRISRVGKVMEAIHPWRIKHRGRQAQETIACPICSGRLHLSISAVNGHVHGHCETSDCVSWVE